MAVAPWRKGIFTRITQETHNTRRYWIQIPEMDRFDFKPGQFVTLEFPIHEKPARRWRSYSIASAPSGTNEIELVIVLLEGGAGTTWLFNHVQEGDEIPVRGPQGVFSLPDEVDTDLFFICTGTGIAPFRSMLNHMRDTGRPPHKPIYLISGTRTQKDLLYHQEMTEVEKQLENLHYLPTLSREKWEGRTGYVHPIYEELLAGKQPAHFYLCGWKEMINEAKQRIQALGYDRKMIHQELYG
jgi:CDP-4-dehydro-6-deoxyglucose reductase